MLGFPLTRQAQDEIPPVAGPKQVEQLNGWPYVPETDVQIDLELALMHICGTDCLVASDADHAWNRMTRWATATKANTV